MIDTVLKTEGLYHRYPTRDDYALSDVNLSIQRGEFLALIGQNGSGKTTLIKHFNGLLKPTEGRVLVEGRETTDLPTSELAKSVGYVFQNPDHQIFAEKVRDEIIFGPRNLGFSQERIEVVTQQVLADMDLAGTEEDMPFQLSRGQRQRLAVASVLAMEPSILIIDEPTTGQDWKQSLTLMQLVEGLNNKGHTCIVTTHNMNLVSLFSRRVVVMWRGKILLDGPTQDVFREVELLARAGIKPPEVYEVTRTLMPEIKLDKPITPDDLAELLVERVIAPRQQT
jgi:energy-coupling factor transporter ATP-binding protein EcfA2